jgi:hypothetical protein
MVLDVRVGVGGQVMGLRADSMGANLLVPEDIEP